MRFQSLWVVYSRSLLSALLAHPSSPSKPTHKFYIPGPLRFKRVQQRELSSSMSLVAVRQSEMRAGTLRSHSSRILTPTTSRCGTDVLEPRTAYHTSPAPPSMYCPSYSLLPASGVHLPPRLLTTSRLFMSCAPTLNSLRLSYSLTPFFLLPSRLPTLPREIPPPTHYSPFMQIQLLRMVEHAAAGRGEDAQRGCVMFRNPALCDIWPQSATTLSRKYRTVHAGRRVDICK
ncbi:hypothetical protein B0H13DRAFT_2315614 [Mycena leptocephala]|nr:hypothetical protein B0H13DRAFT_2315614 [Mycena leptocephala]